MAELPVCGHQIVQIHEDIINSRYFLNADIGRIRRLQLVIVFLVIPYFSIFTLLYILGFHACVRILAKLYEQIDEFEVVEF